MKSLLAIVVIGMLCAGCAVVSSPAKDLLNQADMKLAAEDYSGAVDLYTELVDGYPDDAQASRARATRTALERLLTAQTEIGRVQSEELPRVRRELSVRQIAVDQLKAEMTKLRADQIAVDQLKAEMAKLRADLERLRNIDLQDSRPGIKK